MTEPADKGPFGKSSLSPLRLVGAVTPPCQAGGASDVGRPAGRLLQSGRRRSLLVSAGEDSASDRPGRVLEQRLAELGIETTYLGQEHDANRIAAIVAEERADAIELYMGPGCHGVRLLRGLLRELIAVGRRDVSIVVHRAR